MGLIASTAFSVSAARTWQKHFRQQSPRAIIHGL